jgi:hypothetical protein
VATSPDDNNSTRESDQSELHTRRIFADGEVWLVREVRAPVFDRRGGTHLIFEGAEVMRRVRNFRSDWLTLTDDELYALSLEIRNT